MPVTSCEIATREGIAVLVESEQFRRYFDDHKKSAWRFEAQPTYTMPNEQEDLFLVSGRGTAAAERQRRLA
jgi:hypothetical protein